MSKQKSYKEQETEKQRGKKRYIERRIEEDAAEKEIKEYTSEGDEEHIEDSTTIRNFN